MTLFKANWLVLNGRLLVDLTLFRILGYYVFHPTGPQVVFSAEDVFVVNAGATIYDIDLVCPVYFYLNSFISNNSFKSVLSVLFLSLKNLFGNGLPFT